MTEVFLDGSKYQGKPDFIAVKASGVEGVVWNCDDPSFTARINEAHAATLRCAAYHFTSTGVLDAKQQAQHFVDMCRPVRPLLEWLAGDHETGSGDLTAWVLAYQQELERLDGHVPWLYSGGWWIVQHIKPDATSLTRYPLWDAAYTPTEPGPPPPWTSIAMWQHTSSASVPGIVGNVDTNYLYVSGAAAGGDTLNAVEVSAVIAGAYDDIGANAFPGTPVSVAAADFAHQVDAVMSGAADLETVVNNIRASHPQPRDMTIARVQQAIADALVSLPAGPAGPPGPQGAPGADRIVRTQGGPT